jgi:hypothetical protein
MPPADMIPDVIALDLYTFDAQQSKLTPSPQLHPCVQQATSFVAVLQHQIQITRDIHSRAQKYIDDAYDGRLVYGEYPIETIIALKAVLHDMSVCIVKPTPAIRRDIENMILYGRGDGTSKGDATAVIRKTVKVPTLPKPTVATSSFSGVYDQQYQQRPPVKQRPPREESSLKGVVTIPINQPIVVVQTCLKQGCTKEVRMVGGSHNKSSYCSDVCAHADAATVFESLLYYRSKLDVINTKRSLNVPSNDPSLIKQADLADFVMPAFDINKVLPTAIAGLTRMGYIFDDGDSLASNLESHSLTLSLSRSTKSSYSIVMEKAAALKLNGYASLLTSLPSAAKQVLPLSTPASATTTPQTPSQKLTESKLLRRQNLEEVLTASCARLGIVPSYPQAALLAIEIEDSLMEMHTVQVNGKMEFKKEEFSKHSLQLFRNMKFQYNDVYVSTVGLEQMTDKHRVQYIRSRITWILYVTPICHTYCRWRVCCRVSYQSLTCSRSPLKISPTRLFETSARLTATPRPRQLWLRATMRLWRRGVVRR